MFESENAMVENFIATTSETAWTRHSDGGEARSVFESECSEGRADWVWARIESQWPQHWNNDASRVLQNPSCSRILSYLKRSSPRTKAFLRNRLGVSPATFNNAIRDLVKSELVDVKDKELFLLSKKLDIPPIEICAFEFKLKDWRRAFFQATRYRNFAHRVYVVLPASIIHRTEKLHDAFRTQNIGLLSHDAEGNTRRVINSRKRSPRSRSNLYQALGMLEEHGRTI